MRPECIPKPTKEQWELTALEFENPANFPHCLGAVDGKHIRVIKPEHSAALCTLTLVVTEKTAILQCLNDLRYGH